MKTLHRTFIAVLFLLSFFGINILNAQNFYVSTTGLDTNPGTEALPWKTVAKAASMLTAGQTAFVRGGTYNERFTFTNSGTEGNYITVTAYPNETPIIDGTGLGSVSLVSLGTKSYVKVSGLRVQNGYIGIYSGGNKTIIEKNYVYNFTNPGIQLSAASNSIVRNNVVERAVSSSWGECITSSQCEYIDICYNEVKNGTTNTAGGEGIDVKGSKHMRVYGNTIHDLPAKLGIYIDAYDGLDYDLQIFNNKIYNCTNGIVIGSELANDVEKIWAYNNVIYNMTTGEGIKVVDYLQKNYRAKNIIIENNSMSGCKGISIDGPNGSDFTIRNNIFYNCSSTITIPAPPTNLSIVNNLSNSGTVSGTGAIIADPLFTDPTAKDFSLKTGSPAIDKGTSNDVPFDFNFNTRPVGIGNDIGAYEYGSTELYTLPTVTKPAFTATKSAVTQSTDDGTENTSTGAVTLTSTTLTASFTSTSSKNIIALRFSNVNIPKGATITSARIKVKSSAASSSGNYPIKINAEKIANSETLTAATKSISSKIRTINAAYWAPGTVSSGASINTSCLDFVVAELVSSPDWVSGNAMTFIIEYVSGSGKSIQFNGFDSGSSVPELNIEYTLDNTNDVKAINQPENAVKVFPNPASEFITIDFQGKNYNSFLVTDMLGKVISNKNIDQNTNNLVLDVKNWKKGIHFVQLQNNSNIATCKVIVN